MNQAGARAAALVADRPAFLHSGPDDKFIQRPVISSAGMQYVPYERTYRDLPVVGGSLGVVRAGPISVAGRRAYLRPG